MRGGSGHAGFESSVMDTPSESNTTDAPSSVSLPASSAGSTALSDTESESTTLAVANVIATAPLTLTIVAGVTVITDISELRSPAGRKGRRVVEELGLVIKGRLWLLVVEAPVVGELVIEGESRPPAIKAPIPSPLEESTFEFFDDSVALVGDCDATVTSIPNLQARGDEGFMRTV